MKHIFLLLASCITLSCSRQGPVDNSPIRPPYTELGGSLSGSLIRSESPFKVIQDIHVDSLDTLTIEAGVEIYFQDTTKFLIQGNLLCNGTSTNRILFSSFSSRWGGIIITGDSVISAFHFSVIENVDITTGTDINRNGAVEISKSRVTLTNCIFRNNKANHGGAISLDGSQSLITNCLFVSNYAVGYGGAILSLQSSNQFINNTFFGNHCVNYGGGLVLRIPVFDEVQNNIFFMNTSGTGDPRIAYLNTDSTHYLSEFNFLHSGTLDPQFQSESDLHLKPNSPCVDAGNPENRFNDANGSRNDQGAYGGPLGDW